MDAPGVTTGDSLDQNAQNAPRCVSRSLLRDCELFSHGLLDFRTNGKAGLVLTQARGCGGSPASRNAFFEFPISAYQALTETETAPEGPLNYCFNYLILLVPVAGVEPASY